MLLSVAGIISVAVFIVIGYSCFRNGLYSALVMLFVIALSAAVSVACLGPIMNMDMVGGMGEESRSYVPALCWLGVFILSLVVMQTMANYLFPPRLVMPRMVDVVGGTVLGLANACFLTGFLMLGFALFPGTGDASDKVVFLNADTFVAKSMEWMSARAGSVDFNADKFLEEARKEKYVYRVRERKDNDLIQENSDCFRNLDRLGQALKKYIEAEGGYPESLKDIARYFPGAQRLSVEQIRVMTVCPATELPYKLFPAQNFRDIAGDEKYVLMYDAVEGEVGHLGNGKGQRPVLFANFKVNWTSDARLKALLEAQKNVLKKD